MPFRAEFTSALAAPPDEVWRHASSMAGVNRELAPWVRMTVPHGVAHDLLEARVGEEAFTSVLLFLRVVPFDVHHLTFERLLDRGFVEESWSWLNRRWRHERHVEPDGEGCCVVTDRLVVEPRFAPTWLVAPFVGRIFLARHSYLRRRFGRTRVTGSRAVGKSTLARIARR